MVDALRDKGLSAREIEVAQQVAKGLPNKVVASNLFVTEKTVKFHLTNIYKKMQVKSRSQLIVWCLPFMQFVEEKPFIDGKGANPDLAEDPRTRLPTGPSGK